MGEPSMNEVFMCSEITKITGTFKTCIGEGAYGQFFRGIMSDGTPVAVKVLSTQDCKDFSEEVKLLRIHHPNLVTLVGYCDYDVKKALIYEYIPNGDLLGHLSENSDRTLLWYGRLKIAEDIAEGINFLHNQELPIVYRDLKPSNVLLTRDMKAKIADFGLSRVFPTEFATHVSTRRAGIFGYLDPYVLVPGHACRELDVYSFGVILLVLLTGKPAIIGEGNDAVHITQRIESVTKSFTKKKKSSVIDSESIQSIIDPRLQGEFDIYAAKKAIKFAMSCVKPITTGRPNMSHALEKLKAISNPKEKTRFFTKIITWVRSCFPFANSQSQNISYQMDKEGIPSIALANKATGQAIKHSIEATPLVQLVSHDPKKVDGSLTFTACDLPSSSSANPQNISDKWHSSDKPSFKVYCKTNSEFSLSISSDGKLILAATDLSDSSQHWYKYEGYGSTVEDKEGIPSFALVNKATAQAIKYSTEADHPVQLVSYNPNEVDKSVLWTEEDSERGYKSIRVATNTILYMDAHCDYVMLWPRSHSDNQL